MSEAVEVTDSGLLLGDYIVGPGESLILYDRGEDASGFHPYAKSVPGGEHVNVLKTPADVELKLRVGGKPGVFVSYQGQEYLTSVSLINVSCGTPEPKPVGKVSEPEP